VIIYNIKTYVRSDTTNNKYAIVILTRGYSSNDKYNDLIKRNNYIYKNYYCYLKNKEKYDIIIFNEGNITDDQQVYIQNKTPYLPLIFKTVEFINNNNTNDICPPNIVSQEFSLGYKNMCYFWSINFYKYVEEYEYIIRIDEDCYINKIDPNIILTYIDNNIKFSSAEYIEEDTTYVTVGMENLFMNYIKANQIVQYDSIENVRYPYTNVMVINVPYFRKNQNIQNMLNLIKESNCIFSNRWGDLPIWGYILYLLVDKQYYICDRNISYYHGSHNYPVNFHHYIVDSFISFFNL